VSVATDHALATIASILDEPGPAPGQDKPVSNDIATAENGRDASPPTEADGYSRTGPGPMAALRFKWTVRRGDDGYYVDETVGLDSVPVSSGPMTADGAIELVDARATEAHQRFEALKTEMIGPGPNAPSIAAGIGEK
jgi:hypothetical protein